jgi:hypothetical protein
MTSYLPSNVPLVPVFHQRSLRNLPTASHDMPSSTQDVKAEFKRFRILVVGRANADKTILLWKVCNATGKPEIFDSKGNKVDATFNPISALPTDQS